MTTTLQRTTSYFTRPTQLLVTSAETTQTKPKQQQVNQLFAGKHRSLSHKYNDNTKAYTKQQNDVRVVPQLGYFGRKRKHIGEWCERHTGLIALVLLFIIITSLLLSILFTLILAPVFMSVIICCTCMILVFVMTESTSWGYWHHNREAESRFWSSLAAVSTAALLFAPDSPCPIGLEYPTVGLILVFSSAIMINHYDRVLEREQLTYTPQLPKIKNNSISSNVSAKEKLDIVVQAVYQLDYKFVGAKLINQYGIQKQITLIIDTLSNANTDELNYIVTNANLALLFYKIKDRDVLVWTSYSLSSRSRVLKLLAEDRLNELGVHARAAVLDALMRMRLTAHMNAEQWVRNIIVSTQGRQLTRLKNITDNKGRFHNLHKLIFKDISNPQIRNEILQHIKQQAELLSEELEPHTELQLAPNNSEINDPQHKHSIQSQRHKVLSDVDDTLFSSGGRFPAGIDRSYTHHVLYPGVLTFYRELELGLDTTGIWSDGRIGNLTFLSARPHVYKDKSESKTYQLFDQLKSAGMHCTPTLLAGALDSGIRVFTGDYIPLALTKYDNFVAYCQLYPEYKFIFVGDNGQGDVICAQKMCEYIPVQMSAIFIHQVQPVHLTPGYIDNKTEQYWSKLNIHFFNTYVEAALIAAKLHLIHIHGLRRIIRDVHKAYQAVKANKLSYDIEQRRCEFNADIAKVNIYLQSIHEKPVAYIHCEQQFYIDALVMTPYGPGIICGFEPIHGIYDVLLHTWKQANNQSPHAYILFKYIQFYTSALPGTLVSTYLGIGLVQDFRLTDGQHQIILEWNATAYMLATQLTVLPAAVNEKVKTKYGIGIVEQYRRSDNMYQIRMKYGLLYMNASENEISVLEADRSSCTVM